MSDKIEVWPGKVLTAARGLADLTTRELSALASVSRDTLTRAETADVILISPKQRHGCIARPVWDRIVAALASAGVELGPETETHGVGVRLARPR